MTDPIDRETLGREFLADFEAMSRIGATGDGGVDRQAATAEDGRVREWLSEWLEHNGFTVRVDGIGNLFGTYEFRPGAPFVVAGSHLDSQPYAGRFDGAYGVLAAAFAAREAVRRAAADGVVPEYNIAVVDWFNEEGSRFKPSMMGSAVFTGLLDRDVALRTPDPLGVTVQEALTAIGGLGTDIDIAVDSYSEIHVEQGKALETSGVPIGVVESTWSAYKYTIRVHGEQGHTGSTLMPDRRDALLGAAHLVVAVNDLVDQFDEAELHTSVGELTVIPNSPVVIARQVDMLVDLRARESSTLDRALELLTAAVREIESRTRTRVEFVGSSVWSSGPFDRDGMALAEEVAHGLGFGTQRVLTLAGHDATNMKTHVPVVLLFVPSVGGVSHNVNEFTEDDDLVAGVEVFRELIWRRLTGAASGRDER